MKKEKNVSRIQPAAGIVFERNVFCQIYRVCVQIRLCSRVSYEWHHYPGATETITNERGLEVCGFSATQASLFHHYKRIVRLSPTRNSHVLGRLPLKQQFRACIYVLSSNGGVPMFSICKFSCETLH